MNAIESNKLLNKCADLRKGGLVIRVKILDVRSAWNRIDCYVTPAAGSGADWVALGSLSDIREG